MKYGFRLLWVLVVSVLVFALAGIFATWEPDRPVSALSARWAMAPSQFILVNGMQVHIRDEGPRNDPHPIVLLHGTSDSLHTWQGWADGLKGQRRVIRFDLPGFGLTGPDPKDDYSIANYVVFVRAVLDQLGVKSFVIGGNSLGGQIAWATALALPQRVRQLVLVDSAGYVFVPRSVPLGFLIARLPGMRKLFEYVLPRGVVQSSVRNVFGDPGKVRPEQIDRFYDLTLREGNRRALAIRMEQVFNADEEQIKMLRVPTLVLWGAKDNLIPLENGKRFEADISGSQLVVFSELGHVPQEEDPVATLAALKKFLVK
jgi:pimeloyl-ACP methyl ester carboxylesterase